MQNNKQKTYEDLRYRIITNHLAPGTKLSEKEMTEFYNIGRTPLRDVFSLLERDGLIDRYPRSGTLVAPMHFPLLRQTIEIRMELEPLAARLAAARIDPTLLKKFRTLTENINRLENDRDENFEFVMNRYEFEFHHLVYEAAKNQKLEETLNELHGISARFWHYFELEGLSYDEQIQDILMMAEALETRDGDCAAKIMKTHLLRFVEEIKSSIVELS